MKMNKRHNINNLFHRKTKHKDKRDRRNKRDLLWRKEIND